ncbi:MAG: hypothetical protein IME94_02445 [Proteobacteria bacterium]|nr:hypothetical protein [Pseudomonadota bacterium]
MAGVKDKIENKIVVWLPGTLLAGFSCIKGASSFQPSTSSMLYWRV